jgi:hypothetical protein
LLLSLSLAGWAFCLAFPDCAGELVVVLLHVDFSAAEAYSFGFQPEALLDGGVSAQLDFSTCA